MTRPPGPPLFTGLRLRLTGLYLLASLALVALVGGGAYGLLSNFFSAANDDALNRKMASELATQGLRPPPDNRAGPAPAVSTRPSQNDRAAIEQASIPMTRTARRSPASAARTRSTPICWPCL